jgi:hypothetical protein
LSPARASASGWEADPHDESLFELDPPLARVRYTAGEFWAFHALAPAGSANHQSASMGRIVEPTVGSTLSLLRLADGWGVLSAPELELPGSFDALELRLPVSADKTWGALTLTATAARALRRGDDEWSYGLEGAYEIGTSCALSVALTNVTDARLRPETLEYAVGAECSPNDVLSVHGKALTDTRETSAGGSQHFVFAGVAVHL